MKTSKLREKTIEEIQQELNENVQKLFQFKFENSSGQLKNPRKIVQLRRDIARMKTIINEKAKSMEKK